MHKPLADPTNRVVASFKTRALADRAQQTLLDAGIEPEELRIFTGESVAEKVDVSPKWFADTDVEIRRYKRALAAGQTVLSVEVGSSEEGDSVQAILASLDTELVTYFGEWVTETI